ncbi:MAG: PilT/PilU family type 4a pilus ATPase [Candidatus Marithrix sp.]|nr:PilT/PilU family type 4a pilus ATPase [Candidatus Marithrix sp.]
MDLSPYLKLMLDKKGSDLLITVGSPIIIKLNGKDKPVGKTAITADIAKATAFAIMSDEQKKQFVKNKEIEFNYSHINGEFKVNVSFENKVVGIVIQPLSTDDADNVEDEKPKEVKPAEDSKEVPIIDSTELLDYLKITYQHDGSDLFLTVGSKIKAKIYGSARPISTFVATPELTKKCTYSILTDEQIAQFEQTHDLDFAVSLPDGSARFRGNAFFQRKTVGLVMRYIPSEIPSAEAMGTPEILLELMMAKRGLMLMVGGTGSGKSTTLAAMIDYRNANSPGHILTIEDPVEFSHPNKMSIVNQREVGVDTNSYATAIKASLREAPDVILIGEIREMETMEAALELANTGHLCVSTMHANNANQALDRIVNMFPTDKQKSLFMDMAGNINAIISQRLIPDTRGKRCAAIEIMINTPNIANLILKGRLTDIKDAMKSSGARGMATFDDALFNLFKADKISKEEALKNADSRNDLEGKISFG